MRYMLMIYLDEAKFEPLTRAEQEGFTNAMLDFDEELMASGHYVMSEALQLPGEAVTVRRWDGILSTTDGPFMETKEHLSGFFVIEARDLNEAIGIAGRMPLATMCSIEIRPFRALERIPQ